MRFNLKLAVIENYENIASENYENILIFSKIFFM